MFNSEVIKKLSKMANDLLTGHRFMEKDPSKFAMIDDGTEKLSLDEANAVFNKMMVKTVCDMYPGILKYNEGKVDWATFSNPLFNHAFFTLTLEVIQAILPKTLTSQFDMLTNIHSTAWNEKKIIEVTSPDYFAVSKVSNGNTNLRRQRLDRRSIEFNPVMRGVKVGESIFRILSGQSDWATFINKIAISMAAAIKIDVYNGIYNSYNDLDALYKTTGVFLGDTLVTMAQRTKAACGGLQPIIIGTELALSKVLPSTGVAGMTSYSMMDEYNSQGYLGTFRGFKCFALDQALVPNTQNFAINDSFLLIIPIGANKIANLVMEGTPITTTNNNELNANMEMEYTYMQAWDTAVLSPARYSIYRMS